MQQRALTKQPSEIPEDIICPIPSHMRQALSYLWKAVIRMSLLRPNYRGINLWMKKQNSLKLTKIQL